MGKTKSKKKVVSFPLSVFDTADAKDDLEDWLSAHDPDFIKRMRKAGKDDLGRKGKNWETIKKELCIQ